ncbi:phospholipase A1 VesT1.02-like [Cloeon dipterum]|uniref:phospholipase A1 VesT1.02-like n=1 Tax=Cloeon dipterum TaxID=197152 RepID=UPI00321FCE6A
MHHLLPAALLVHFAVQVFARPGIEIIPPVLEPAGAEEDETDNEVEEAISTIQASPGEGVEWMLMPGANGEVHLAVLSPPPAMDDALRYMRPTDVEFFLYSRDNPDEPERAYFKKSCKPSFKFFKSSRPTKFLIHGFGDGVQTSLMYPILKEAFLTKEDANVFLVDWSQLAGTPWYKAAVGNTRYVGRRVAYLIEHLVNSSNANVRDFHIVGFSLGSHVAGIAGAKIASLTGQKLPRITGLDPASVLYGGSPLDERLDVTDADYVEVVHTSGGYLGYLDPIGKVDFFPNGGSWPQPGCFMDFVAVCSHRRAYYYFAEALLTDNGFKAESCMSWHAYELENCPESSSIFMGSHELPDRSESMTGNFFLRTHAKEPYQMADE